MSVVPEITYIRVERHEDTSRSLWKMELNAKHTFIRLVSWCSGLSLYLLCWHPLLKHWFKSRLLSHNTPGKAAEVNPSG